MKCSKIRVEVGKASARIELSVLNLMLLLSVKNKCIVEIKHLAFVITLLPSIQV
jgi:hypothetical protein